MSTCNDLPACNTLYAHYMHTIYTKCSTAGASITVTYETQINRTNEPFSGKALTRTTSHKNQISSRSTLMGTRSKHCILRNTLTTFNYNQPVHSLQSKFPQISRKTPKIIIDVSITAFKPRIGSTDQNSGRLTSMSTVPFAKGTVSYCKTK